MQLASRFGNVCSIRTHVPLSDEQIRAVAPSIFAEGAHESRSARYTYIPTIEVLGALRKEGFKPFMACQTRVRNESKREHTKHMLRLRHAAQIDGAEAHEIILLNSHDGTSSYQMLAGMFRFVCSNGLVCGHTMHDIRIRHNGDVVGDVIEGAFTVLDSFTAAEEQREKMQLMTVNRGEQAAFARAALALKYEDIEPGLFPISEAQVLMPRRFEDRRDDLWSVFNRAQENLTKGGLRARSANGRASTTRPLNGIDQNIKLNRALWILAEEMQRLKAA